jgi:hypothetical protein
LYWKPLQPPASTATRKAADPGWLSRISEMRATARSVRPKFDECVLMAIT